MLLLSDFLGFKEDDLSYGRNDSEGESENEFTVNVLVKTKRAVGISGMKRLIVIMKNLFL